jgi:DNA repair protein RadB
MFNFFQIKTSKYISLLKILVRMDPGSTVLSDMFGNYLKNRIYLFYGPAAAGKTTCCLLAAREASKQGFKTVYLDSENGFSSERFEQICGTNAHLDNLFLVKISSFSQQLKSVENLTKLADNDKVKMIVLDTVGIYYRVAYRKDTFLANKYLNMQLDILTSLAKKGKIIIIANQVYNSPDSKEISMVGGSIVSQKADTIIELEKDVYRFMTIKKHFSENKKDKFYFRIDNEGIMPLAQQYH